MLSLSKKMTALSGMADLSEPGKDYEPADQALMAAIEAADIVALQQVLKSKPALNRHLGKFDSFPLERAMSCEGRTVEMVRLLLDSGADAGFATPDGYTALHGIAD